MSLLDAHRISMRCDRCGYTDHIPEAVFDHFSPIPCGRWPEADPGCTGTMQKAHESLEEKAKHVS